MCFVDQASGVGACRTDADRGCTAGSCPAGLACVHEACVQTCEETAECGGTVCTEVGAEERVCAEPTPTSCTSGVECAFGICDGGYCDGARAVAAGWDATCVLLASGRIACMGRNAVSMLTRDGVGFVTTPSRVVDGEGSQPPFEAVDLGTSHVCALEGGRIRCWGSGNLGQNGALAPVLPIPTAFASPSGIREVSAAVDTSCVRTATSVYCFGSDTFGQLGDAAVHPGTDPSSASPVLVELPASAGAPVDIDVGGYHACAVMADGALYCWGANDFAQVLATPGATCRYLGMDVACHQTPQAVPGFGPGGIVAVEVALGQSHTCVRDDAGAVRCFGSSVHGQLGHGMIVMSVPDPVVAIASGAVELVSGQHFSCARLDDGAVACWGRNERGQLGSGVGGGAGAPTLVEGITDAIDLTAGRVHACVLERSGEVSCWGEANAGALGDGGPADPSMRDPVPVPVVVRAG